MYTMYNDMDCLVQFFRYYLHDSFLVQTFLTFIQQLLCSMAHSSIFDQLLHILILLSICFVDTGVESAPTQDSLS
jgi:hypothetical protein